MTNEVKAAELAIKLEGEIGTSPHSRQAIEEAIIEMAKWKDEQMKLLLDAIDHDYLQMDGTYGELSYEVSDKVKYLKNQIKK